MSVMVMVGNVRVGEAFVLKESCSESSGLARWTVLGGRFFFSVIIRLDGNPS